MVSQTWCVALAMVLLGLWLPTAAWAKRVALVIGNGSYQSAGLLPNPPNDATLIADALRGVGFTVTQEQDLGRMAMERAILTFGREAQGAQLALVYFAGHGIQSEGRNFLIPVDAQLADDLALPIETVDLDVLLRAMQGATTRLIILDACRNNPLAAQMRVTQAGRSIERGLAPVSTVGGGTLIAFSTAPGTVALDGNGRYSPFAESFARALAQPGLEIRQILTQVRREVLAKTNQRQMPWDNSSLLLDVFLAGEASRPIEPEPMQQPPQSVPPPTPQITAGSNAPQNARWTVEGANTLVDRTTGLRWTRSDNGQDINVLDAANWCRSKGGNWRLPSESQLQSLFDESLPGVPCGRERCVSTRCGSPLNQPAMTCKVPSQFVLSSYLFWTDRTGLPAGRARTGDSITSERFNLAFGVRGTSSGAGLDPANPARRSVRALCVN